MSKLKLAIQKSGRLSEKSVQLLLESGIQLSNGRRNLVAASSNFPVDILYLRDDDIPQYVWDGVADLGIAGENVVKEKKPELKVIEELGFAKCRLSLAIPRSLPYEGLKFFQGKKIATSYPGILSAFLRRKKIRADIHEISGSVEIAPGIGLADAILDIVSSGSTLISNGLKEVHTVMHSEAVLISGEHLAPGKQEILDRLLFRFRSVKKSRNHKYILLNAPNDKIPEIVKIIPGMKSPTVMPLADKGWSSVHSVLSENKFWEIIDRLRALGAQGILVIPIEKMIV